MLALGGIEGFEGTELQLCCQEMKDRVELFAHVRNCVVEGTEVLAAFGFEWLVVEVENADRLSRIRVACLI